MDMPSPAAVCMAHTQSDAQRHCNLPHWHVPWSDISIGRHDHLGDIASGLAVGGHCDDGFDRRRRRRRYAFVSVHRVMVG